MTHKLGASLILCILFSSTFAMSATTDDAKIGYCNSATLPLRMNSEESSVRQVYDKCSVGDIFSMPGNSTMPIARICDFSKQIYRQSDGLVICVIGPLKPVK